MAFTIAQQIRQALVQNYVVRHEVTTAITDQGDLPSKAVFVMEIRDPNDPQLDKLVRVAGIPDFNEYIPYRKKAVREVRGFYRTSALTLQEPSLQDANNQALQLQDQLNRLVEDYQLYLTAYETGPTGETIMFPTPNIGLLTPLIKSYNDKVAAVAAQQAVVDAAEATQTQAQTDYDEIVANCAVIDASSTALSRAVAVAESALVMLTTRRAENQALSTVLRTGLAIFSENEDTVSGGLGGILDIAPRYAWALIQSYFSPGSAVADEVGTRWFPAQTLLDQDINTLNAELDTLRADDQALQDEHTDCLAAKATAQLAVDTAAAAVSAAEAVLTELETQRDAILAEIITLCPDFTP